MTDSLRRAEEAATDTGACLEPTTGGADPCGTYVILKRWYWHISARAPNHSLTDMEKFRGELQTLYQRKEPHTPGLPLEIHIDTAMVNKETPSEA